METTLGARFDAVHGGTDLCTRVDAGACFRTLASDVLVVTDVATCCIELPALDKVTNYDFLGLPGRIVLRVGWCCACWIRGFGA